MKRVIQGKTYNTDTSTIVARWSYDDEKEREVRVDLYQNRGGAFFEVHRWVDDDDERYRFYFEPTDRDGVARVLNGSHIIGGIEVIDEQALSPPPEAEDAEEPSATIYLRLPPTLKERAEMRAKEAGLSLNAWTLRCVEQCAGPRVVADQARAE